MATRNGSRNGEDQHTQLDLLTPREEGAKGRTGNGNGSRVSAAATNGKPVESEKGARTDESNGSSSARPADGNGSPATSAAADAAATSAAKDAAVYDESKVKTLSSLEHIRLRTGMYIGRLGNGSDPEDGIYVLLKEVIDNAVDEFIMGHGRQIDVSIEDNRVRVRDFGRGIPLGKVVECTSIINTGAKYNDEVFQFSVGLNGVGAKAVNALSVDFRVVAYRNGRYAEAV
ncbi:MAG: hypothetical protein F4014_07795, partial [Gemmatimonadetes bacterium]|nr:hypothetical protein [Gemmatimonadota bacterium]